MRSDWAAETPPDTGWIDVKLPDDWSLRWPDFDGVVWYRLRWTQPVSAPQVGLLLNYFNMAGRVSLNGTILAEDDSLVEPLSRSWNRPRHWLLPAPLLRPGENTLLVRVSGLAAYQPGLGPVEIGPAAVLQDRYDREVLLRRDLQIVSIAVAATMAGFFLTLWAMRRRETAYGWFAAQLLAWIVVAMNQVVTSPWPFRSTDALEAVGSSAILVYGACHAMFVLRFCGRRAPRLETAYWALVAICSAWVLLAPHTSMRSVRDLLMLLALVLIAGTILLFVFFAWKHGRTDQKLLSLCGLINLVAGAHDALVFVRILDSNAYYASFTAQTTAVGAALVLAGNLVRSLRRIEAFNTELAQAVEVGRADLAASLRREHELEIRHARLGERTGLAHDLHDGLGGMLISNIATLEQGPRTPASSTMLDALKAMRDDLRLIIDGAAAQHDGERSLADLMAPLRHRMTRLFEAHGIAVRWRVRDIETLCLTASQSLDLLRILQEALTNAFKHSGASRVEVGIRNDAGAVSIEVMNNGIGFDAAGDESRHGTGLRSMRERARRLNATIAVVSEPGACGVRLLVPARPPGPGRPAALPRPAGAGNR
ncbi:ATP-binding protein [Inquilinus sp. CA228]|uniref:sensor histidine kinase n=1 Tax=Inquilinus sp. CA228 TaxID=3455609 RepID=UPI003F8D8AE4